MGIAGRDQDAHRCQGFQESEPSSAGAADQWLTTLAIRRFWIPTKIRTVGERPLSTPRAGPAHAGPCCLHRRTHTQSCPRLYPAEHQLRRAFVSHIHIEQGTHRIVPDPKELHQAVSIGTGLDSEKIPCQMKPHHAHHVLGHRCDLSGPSSPPHRPKTTWRPAEIVLGESGPDQRASQAPSAHDSQAHQPVRYLRLRSPIVTPPHYLLGTRPQVHQMQIKPRPAPRRSGPGRSSACRCPPRC